MMSRRQLFTWWRSAPEPEPAVPPPFTREPEPAVPPPFARAVAPVWIDDPEPFSLEAFYRDRAAQRRPSGPTR